MHFSNSPSILHAIRIVILVFHASANGVGLSSPPLLWWLHGRRASFTETFVEGRGPDVSLTSGFEEFLNFFHPEPHQYLVEFLSLAEEVGYSFPMIADRIRRFLLVLLVLRLDSSHFLDWQPCSALGSLNYSILCDPVRRTLVRIRVKEHGSRELHISSTNSPM